jgi:hypothetical protein
MGSEVQLGFVVVIPAGRCACYVEWHCPSDSLISAGKLKVTTRTRPAASVQAIPTAEFQKDKPHEI